MLKLRKGFWIYLPVAIFAWITPVTSAKANVEPVQGLDTTYYTIDEIPPVQSTTEYEECGSELENNINRSYDGEPYEECTGDMFMVHMTGFIDIPEHETIEFWLASDDGGELTIGNNTFGVWQDQGCSATMSGNLTLAAGSVPLEVWMYENGGSTCLMLAWKIDDGDWAIVPDEAFTTSPTVSTTTSEVSTTVEITTSLAPTTTLPQSEPTMPEQSTTSSTTTTSLVVETTTTTEYVSPPVAQPPVVVQPEPIELPTIEDMEPILIDEPETPLVEPPFEEVLPDPITPDTTVSPDQTLPFVEPEITEPDVTEPEIVIEDSIITEEDVNSTLEALDPATELTAEVLEEVFNLLDSDSVTEEQVQEIVDAVIDNLADAEEITDEVLTEVLNILEADSVTKEQVQEIVGTILATDVSSDQATQLATSAAVLENVSSEQATEIFSSIDTGELTVEEAAAIVAAIIDAPTEVKEAFEEEINVFGGGFDEYVATGSAISVGARRVIVAVTTVSFIVPAPVVSRRR